VNLLSAAAKVSSMTMLSRITGLLRETLIARAFGASEMTDAFNVAFRLPNLLRRLFAEGAFSQAFVPILGEVNEKRGQEASKLLINAVATLLFWSLILTVIAGVIGAPWLVISIASGFKDPKTLEISVVLTRLMFPYIALVSLVSLAAGILNTHKRFLVPAITPVLLNLGMIGASLFLSPYFETPIYALGVGVMLGGIAQLAIQIPALNKIGMLPRIGVGIQSIKEAAKNPDAKRILKLMGPAVFAVSVAQLSLIINTNIASYLQAGSVSWLSFADRLMEFPTALLGVAIGTVLLPSLSRANASGDPEQISHLLNWGLRLTFLLAAPSAVALLIFGTPLASALYHYGKFDAQDVEMTRQALMAYGVGLIGLILVKILAPGFYARQDIRTPVKIGLIVLAFTQLANLVFVPWLSHAGLALSIGLGACLNALLLWRGLAKKGLLKNTQGSWLKFLLQLIAGLILMGGVLYLGLISHDWIALQATPIWRLVLLFLWCCAGAGAYFATLWICGIKFKQFLRHTI
jgi:putative peptidoglycan lipid II flippase